MGARVVPDNRPGTHLGFRQQGSSGSVTKVHSGGRSSKLGHLKKKQANGRVLVSLHQSLHGTSVPAVLMAPVLLQHFFLLHIFLIRLCYKDTYMGHSRTCRIGTFNTA